MSISEAKTSDFTFFPAMGERYTQDRPILTVSIDCYYRLELVKQSITSVLLQDYQNVELILIDNGANRDVSEYLEETYKNTTNTSLIKFPVNQFAWDDPEKSVICWNAALIHSKGEYNFHLSYDDCISSNFASRMVALFAGNRECVTAAPMPISIDESGEIKPSSLYDRNRRGRYTDGYVLAFDLIQGNPKKLLAAPGGIFVIKRETLLRYGGYDRMSDLSQVLKYAILGVSGFDPEAALYWRHHEGQLNKQAKRNGIIFYAMLERAWNDSGIVNIWNERFSADHIKVLLDFKKRSLRMTVLQVLTENAERLNLRGLLRALFNTAKECPTLLISGFYIVARELASKAYRSFYSR